MPFFLDLKQFPRICDLLFREEKETTVQAGTKKIFYRALNSPRGLEFFGRTVVSMMMTGGDSASRTDLDADAIIIETKQFQQIGKYMLLTLLGIEFVISDNDMRKYLLFKKPMSDERVAGILRTFVVSFSDFSGSSHFTQAGAASAATERTRDTHSIFDPQQASTGDIASVKAVFLGALDKFRVTPKNDDTAKLYASTFGAREFKITEFLCRLNTLVTRDDRLEQSFTDLRSGSREETPESLAKLIMDGIISNLERHINADPLDMDGEPTLRLGYAAVGPGAAPFRP